MAKINAINNDLSGSYGYPASNVTLSNPNAFVAVDGSGALVSSDSATDGQILIGNSDGAPVLSQISSGVGISVSGSAGEITVSQGGNGGSLKSIQYITSGSGTYTKSLGTTSIFVMCVGAGGGGSGGSSNGVSGRTLCSNGGGGGGVAYKFFSEAPETASYDVGVGGTGGPAEVDSSGTDGGTTSFGVDFYATGGAGGDTANTGVNVSSNGGNRIGRQVSGGSGFGGNYVASGHPCSEWAFTTLATIGRKSSSGGANGLGGGGSGLPLGNQDGVTPSASSPGVGGSGVYLTGTTPRSGGSGSSGLLVIYEFGA